MGAATAVPSITQAIVTNAVLRDIGLNAQAFSGSANPAAIYRMMVGGYNGIFPYYRELEEKDLCVGLSLEVRKMLVLAREWQVVGADEEDPLALQMQEEASAFLNDIPQFSFVLEELCDAPAYGYVVMEIMWRNDGNRVGVDKIIGRPQELFDFRQDLLDPPLGDLRFCPNMVSPGQQVPQEKFLVSTSKPRHGDRRGLPLLRRLYWPSWFKRQGLTLDLKFLEKPVGTIAVMYDANNDDQQQKALAIAEALASEIAVAVPNSVKLIESLLGQTRQRDGKDYQLIIDYLDSEMTRAILGQTLATRGSEQQRGTQALGNVHQDMLYEIVRRDANQVSVVIDEQLLGPWLRWTYGDIALDRSYRPHFKIDVEPEKDMLERARALKEARGLVEIPKRYAREQLGIPAPEEGEELVNSAVVPVELTGIGPDSEADIHQPPKEEDSAKGEDGEQGDAAQD
jgi:phage gp29-like protein